MNKIKKIITMMLALVMVITCVNVSSVQAASKINKSSASIYETETVQLKVKGAKTVTWKSSNKKIASVTKTGLVTGVKKGSCTITAKDSKTKKAYTCKVTVKKAATFEVSAKDIFALPSGEYIGYSGAEIKGVTYVLDGKKLSKKAYYLFTGDDGDTMLHLTKNLTEGKHSFSIQKKGYKTITKTFKIETIKVDGMFADDPWVEDGELWVMCNPELDGKEYVVKVDGNEVTPIWPGLNGDGYFTFTIDVKNLTSGEHNLTVVADGLSDGNATFTIK